MIVKWFSGDYPLHQVVFIRSSVALIVTLAVIMPLDGGFANLRTKRLGLHLLRGLAVVVANLTFFAGIAVLPLSEATAIFFVAPLLITVLSIPLLGEVVGFHRLSAVALGLVGVIIVIRPGSEGFQLAALLPLVAACAYAALQIMTRKMGLTEKASTMAFYIQLTFIIVCSGFGIIAGDGRYAPGDGGSLDFLLRAWVWPEGFDLWLMIGLGGLLAVGGYLISQGYRVAEAGVVAPFEYVLMPLAIFWGIVIWNDWPDSQSWVGIALIISAGVYVFHREAIQGRRNVLDRPMPRNR
jgi:drug/metabolite transporter (DMT)-like permease